MNVISELVQSAREHRISLSIRGIHVSEAAVRLAQYRPAGDDSAVVFNVSALQENLDINNPNISIL